MMKTLRYFFVAALAMVMTNVMAQTEFDFANANDLFNHPGSSSGTGATYDPAGEFTSDATATIGDFSVTVSASAAEVQNKNRIWATAPRLRMYEGTMTIKSAGANIKSIVFTCGTSSSNSKWNDGNTASVGQLSVEKPTITWSGDAKEVVISIAGNTQFTKLVVSADGGVTPPPTPTVETITVAKALELCNALANGAESTDEYIINGFIVADPVWKPYYNTKDDPSSGIKNYNLNVNIADAADAAEGMLVYNIYNLDNTYFLTIDEDVAKGVKVSMQGKLKKYVSGEIVTPEVVKAHFLAIGSKTGIETVKANAKFEGKMYNVAGQVVNKGYKGLVIMNGKKVVLK